MNIGIVTGLVVSTIKHDIYEGRALLVVQPCDANKKPTGSCIIGMDTVQAGPGDFVIYVDEGNSARTVLHDNTAPVRIVLIGIIDSIEQN